MAKIVKLLVLLFLILTSCSKIKKPIENNLSTADIIYTDSFSPENYEYPLSRKYIQPEDTDIGKFINPDSINQIHREIYILINNLLSTLVNGRINRQLFTDNSYNNFFLRYRGMKLTNFNSFRVSEPDETVQEWWIQIKIFTKNKNYIGKIQIIKINETYLINDFTNEIFDLLMK